MPLAYPLAWPLDERARAIRPTRSDLHVAQLSRSGGQTYNGIEQAVVSPAMRWEGKLTLPRMTRQALLNWRAFVAGMQGRVGTVIVPVFEAGRQPWAADQYGRTITPRFARDPSLHGTAFETDASRLPTIAVTAAAAAANATLLTLAPTTAGTIQAGHRFSIGANLYEILFAAPGDGGTLAVQIRPWLRVAIGAATPCEFVAPVCRMKFKTDAEGILDLEGNRIATPEINLLEAV